ncbi:MAG: hypothetical protein JNM56_38000 [Planctomycetia bacterium]|nr:hypothetical protein [Planctomycetia bacterium]
MKFVSLAETVAAPTIEVGRPGPAADGEGVVAVATRQVGDLDALEVERAAIHRAERPAQVGVGQGKVHIVDVNDRIGPAAAVQARIAAPAANGEGVVPVAADERGALDAFEGKGEAHSWRENAEQRIVRQDEVAIAAGDDLVGASPTLERAGQRRFDQGEGVVARAARQVHGFKFQQFKSPSG